MTDDMLDTLTLVDEEGNEHEFELYRMLEIEDQQYAVLIPLEDADDDEGSVVVLKVEVDEEGEEFLTDIQDDKEFDMVVEAMEALEEEE